MTRISGFFLLGYLALSFQSVLAQPQPQPHPKLEFKENHAYEYAALFRYQGPNGWFGAEQANDPITGEPRFPEIAPDARALYLKAITDELVFVPHAEVKIFLNDTDSSAIDFLTGMVKGVKKKHFGIMPASVSIRGREWASTDFKIAAKGSPLELRRKLFTTRLDNLMILFQLTTSEDQYSVDATDFDQSVIGTGFQTA